MIQEVISVGMPVHEKLRIQKNRIEPKVVTGREKRVAICSGIHGDELEGQYICYEDIYPCLNPLGMDALYRNVPKSEIDMNRVFPGNIHGTMMEHVAASIVDDIAGAEICIDVHSSDIFLREIPQVRLSEMYAEKVLPYAKMMNVDMIWTNATRTVDESTLAYSLNMLGVPAMVIELGIGNHINTSYGDQIVDGIFNIMHELGIWDGVIENIRTPVISRDGEIEFIRANEAGLFIPAIVYHQYVQKGEKIGQIVSPLTGETKEVFYAQEAGMVFSLREYPMIYEGALIARILSGIQKEQK